jgi:hypothetical protein
MAIALKWIAYLETLTRSRLPKMGTDTLCRRWFSLTPGF